MDAYDTRGKIADLDQKIEKQTSENSALKSEIKRILLMNAFCDKAKQGMSLKNEKVVQMMAKRKIKIKIN